MGLTYDLEADVIDSGIVLQERRYLLEKQLQVIGSALSYYNFVKRQTSDTPIDSDSDVATASGEPAAMGPSAAAPALATA